MKRYDEIIDHGECGIGEFEDGDYLNRDEVLEELVKQYLASDYASSYFSALALGFTEAEWELAEERLRSS